MKFFFSMLMGGRKEEPRQAKHKQIELQLFIFKLQIKKKCTTYRLTTENTVGLNSFIVV